MKRPHTVIWDFDGTIINSHEVYRASLEEVLPSFGLAMPDNEVLRKNFHGKLEQSIRESVEGIRDEDHLAKIIEAFLVAQQQHYEHPLRHFYPDALEALDRAYGLGMRQIVVTSREHEGRGLASPIHLVAAANLEHMIQDIIPGDASEYHKPDPRLLDVLHGFNLVPEETVVIGDQFVDAEFAHRLGVSAILVDRNGGVPHLERLGDNWQDHTQIVSSLESLFLK